MREPDQQTSLRVRLHRERDTLPLMSGKGAQLDIEQRDHMVVLRGEIDGLTSPDLQEQLLVALDRSADLRIDMSGVTFMDSSGLRVLLALSERARTRSGDVVLAAPSPAVQRVLELSQLGDHFTIV